MATTRQMTTILHGMLPRPPEAMPRGFGMTGTGPAVKKAKPAPEGPEAKVQVRHSEYALMRFHEAAQRGELQGLKDSLEAGIPVDTRDRFKRTPLMGAAFHGSLPAVRLLVANGADVHAHDIDGRTALDMARISKKSHVVRFLKDTTQE